MNKIMLFISVMLFFISASAGNKSLPEAPAGKKWVKIASISDEFNKNQLDLSKWMPKHPGWGGRDSKFTEANVSVKGGKLKLMSSLRSGETKVNAQTVTSACVSSNTQRCNFGYYEARIKCADISMTSAFWFQGKYSEIDVIENIGKPTNPESKWIENTMMTNTHYFKDGWKKDKETPVKWVMPTASSSGYHVYGVWWKDETTIWIYHNGVKVAEIATGGIFDEQQYMFFDTEVFTWRGWPTKESLLNPSKNTMLVDWVRGWELIDDK